MSHQGYNEDAKADLQPFQDRMCWVENQAAVTISLPCTPSMMCPTGRDGCGSGMRYFVPPFHGVDHCVSVPQEKGEATQSPKRDKRAALQEHAGRDQVIISFLVAPRIQEFLPTPLGTVGSQAASSMRIPQDSSPHVPASSVAASRDDPAGTLLPSFSSLRSREGTSPFTHTPATTRYCANPVRFQHHA